MTALLPHARRIFSRRRKTLARLCALAALIVMIASAIRFRPDPLVELHHPPDPASAYEFPPGRPRHDVPLTGVSTAARLMLIGGGLLIAALALGEKEKAWAQQAAPLQSGELSTAFPVSTGWGVRFAQRYALGVMLTLAGVMALAALAEANAQWIGWRWANGMSSDGQFALLAGGIVLVAWGLAQMGPRRGSAGAYGAPLEKGEIALVGAITGLALILRIWNLNDAIHAFVDELNFANAARMAWRTGEFRLLQPITEVVAFPRLYPYWESWTVALLGRNLAGLRLVSALLGTLTVPALYGLARTLVDRQTAFIAAALLASFPAHLHYSRLGMNNIADPLFGTLALACLAYALHTQRRLAYASAGVLLGLTQYFYEAGRIVFPVLVAGWIGIGLVIWRRKPHPPAPRPASDTTPKSEKRFNAESAEHAEIPGGKNREKTLERGSDAEISPLPSFSMGEGSGVRAEPHPQARGLLILLLAAVIAAAPVYYTLLGTQRPVAARSQAMIYPAEHWRELIAASPSSEIFREHLRHVEETFLIYVHQHEASFYYAGETPFVLIYAVPLLLLGTFAAAWRIRTPGGLLPLLWVAATSLGNSFMVANLDSPRYVTVFPALALLCALGLRHTLALLWPDRQRPLLRQITLSTLVIALTAGQTWYYFDSHVDLFNFQYRRAKLDRDFEDALFRSVDFPTGTQIHLISIVRCDQGYATDLLNYLTDGLTVETRTRQDVSTDYLWSLPRTVDHAFFLEPGDQDTLETLRLYFVLGAPSATTSPIAPDKQFVLYYAPATIPAGP